MPNPTIAHYRDARGGHYDIVARKGGDGVWLVLDISVRETTVIETLPDEEGQDQAEAIARDYAAEHDASRANAAAEHA